jgi:hypothetical protein
MRYCPKCESEFQDAVTTCSDDGTPLVDQKQFQALTAGRLQVPERFHRLTAVLLLTDPFEAEELAEALVGEGFNVSVVSNKSQPFGWGTSPGPELFSIVVPDTQADKARVLVAQWQSELEDKQTEQDAEQAADTQEEAGENLQPPV